MKWLDRIFGRKARQDDRPAAAVRFSKVHREPEPPVALTAADEALLRQLKFPIAPVVDDPAERGIQRDFRRPNDARNVIRVNQVQPKGLPKKLASYVPVAGTSFHQDEVIAFMCGRERQIILQLETEGEHVGAIAVIGTWLDRKGATHTAKLGNVPSDVRQLIDTAPVAATLEAMYGPTADKSPGIRIDIWTKRATKKIDPVEGP